MTHLGFFRQRCRSAPMVLHSCFTRSMGGGPRTFPGGINKWQWKRLHEKKAREKERRLLEQERQIYHARIRSHIRGKLAGESGGPNPVGEASNYWAMSAKEHIKVLSDRFMKEGAEDLWNEDDGPLNSEKAVDERQHGTGSPSYIRKMSGDPRNFTSDVKILNSLNLNNNLRPRNFSVQVRKKFGGSYSSADDDSEVESDHELSRFKLHGDLCDEDGVSMNDRNRKPFTSSAALGKYDMITRRRTSLDLMDDEYSAQTVEIIRHELIKRKLQENDEDKFEEDPLLSNKRFDESGISSLTTMALASSGYIHMTRVQEATLSVVLEGNDAIVKSRAGTGKSAAFLIPAIQTILKASKSYITHRQPPLYVLVVCPTKELACQIAAEAKAMLRFHDCIGVQTLIGGTRFKEDQKRLDSEQCQMIIATPGRLLDHIENKYGFSVRLMSLKMFVLDEADHLLKLGFRKDIEKIIDSLPRERQSLLFSATVPQEVRRVSQLVLKREHTFIDTVGTGGYETPTKVKQSYVVASHELHFHMVYHFLKEHIKKVVDYKVIVFCNTTTMTSLMCLLLRVTKMNVVEMHSRKSQLYRSHLSEEFRDTKRVILISSDVSTRGLNYPNVTLVVQVGIPVNREQYVHRIGRTGREGKEGESLLLLAPWEEHFMKDIHDLPIEKIPTPQIESNVYSKIEDSLDEIDGRLKAGVYYAWLGYYNSIREIGRDKTALVELANAFSRSMGLNHPPAVRRKIALKMGLNDVPGLRLRR